MKATEIPYSTKLLCYSSCFFVQIKYTIEWIDVHFKPSQQSKLLAAAAKLYSKKLRNYLILIVTVLCSDITKVPRIHVVLLSSNSSKNPKILPYSVFVSWFLLTHLIFLWFLTFFFCQSPTAFQLLLSHYSAAHLWHQSAVLKSLWCYSSIGLSKKCILGVFDVIAESGTPLFLYSHDSSRCCRLTNQVAKSVVDLHSNLSTSPNIVYCMLHVLAFQAKKAFFILVLTFSPFLCY